MKSVIVMLILLNLYFFIFGEDFQWPINQSDETPDNIISAFGPRNRATQANPEYDHHGGMNLK